MSDFSHGLIVGKFYPPHRGHHELIRAASRQCEHLTVIVAASHAESIPVANRVAWLEEEHAGEANVSFVGIFDDAAIDYTSDQAWAAHNAIFDAALRSSSDDKIDVVFSGEQYGDQLANHHHAVHVGIPRETHVIHQPSGEKVLATGSACREDLAGMWEALAPATRAGLATRIVVVGAESTGTTTVSKALAERFRSRPGIWTQTQWVAEYGRQRSEEKLAALRQADPNAQLADVAWTGEDFRQIAETQNRLEEAAARSGSPVLICDTDSFATQVWERRYLGATSGFATSIEVPAHDIYLVTDHSDVPFEQDGLRDGEHIRARMTEWFLDGLTRTNRSWVLLTGSLEGRIEMATEVAERLLAQRMSLAEPLA